MIVVGRQRLIVGRNQVGSFAGRLGMGGVAKRGLEYNLEDPPAFGGGSLLNSCRAVAFLQLYHHMNTDSQQHTFLCPPSRASLGAVPPFHSLEVSYTNRKLRHVLKPKRVVGACAAQPREADVLADQGPPEERFDTSEIGLERPDTSEICLERLAELKI